MKTEYIFNSERLGFREWSEEDLNEFAKMNADPEVMEYFLKPLTIPETEEFFERLQNHFKKHGYNYFATEILETGEFIGFIGLARQEYESEFTPAVDIGWRLKKSAWGKGYATEGARKCLEYAFRELNLDEVISTCTEKNARSENVMKKIGMVKKGSFNHPKLKEHPDYEKFICYAITKDLWHQRTRLKTDSEHF